MHSNFIGPAVLKFWISSNTYCFAHGKHSLTLYEKKNKQIVAGHFLVNNFIQLLLLWQLCHSVTQLCPTFWDPMDCSMPGLSVLHHLLEFAQTHVHRVGDVIQQSCLLLPPSPTAFSLFQHQSLFQWVSSSHKVAKIVQLQFQHQSFQWIFRTDLL